MTGLLALQLAFIAAMKLCVATRLTGASAGRCGKTGVATTFINKNCSEQMLLDLKYLLKEAKQRIPPVSSLLFACCAAALMARPKRCPVLCGVRLCARC